jgi:hypothetical protein
MTTASIDPNPFVVSETTAGAPIQVTLIDAPATPLVTVAEGAATE